MAEENGKRVVPPYLAFRTILNFLDKLKSGGIPTRIDRSYWGSFLSGSNGPLVLATLRFFDLLNSEDEPTPALERLANEQDDRKSLMKDLLTTHYTDVLAGVGDLSRATSAQLDKAFQGTYRIEGATRRKAITFFIQAAQYADMSVSPFITSRTRARSTASRTNTAARTVAQRSPRGNGAAPATDPIVVAPDESQPPSRRDGNIKTIELRSGGEVTLSVSVNLFELDEDERSFVLSLVDQFRKHERQMAEKAHVADEETGVADTIPLPLPSQT